MASSRGPDDSKHKPKKLMTFRGFIPQYRAYKMANQEGTTVHGYETNIRTHYLRRSVLN